MELNQKLKAMIQANPTLNFFVPGNPKPQPRPRAWAKKVGTFHVARVYDPATAEGWKAQIAVAARLFIPLVPMTGAIVARLDFAMPRPKSHYRKCGQLKPGAPSVHTSKPDSDNLAKAVLDVLTGLRFWLDDGQVYGLIVTKRYSDQEAGCSIQIHPEAQDTADRSLCEIQAELSL